MTSLYFHEVQAAVFLSDNVHFLFLMPPVASQQFKTMPYKIFSGYLFAPFSKVVMPCHNPFFAYSV